MFGRTEQLEDGSSVVVDEAYIRESILMPQAKIVAGFADVAAMPEFSSLTDDQIESIILFLKTIE